MIGSSAQRRRLPDHTLLVACLVVLGATIAYPALRMFVEAFANWEWEVVTQGAGRQAVVNTLLMCFASVVTAGVVGTALAFLVARFAFPGRRPLAAMAYLPFALPPLVGTLSFYYLIGLDGVFTRIVHRLTPYDDWALTGPGAILLIHTYSFYVFFYAMVAAALENLDISQQEAARTLGAGRWRVFTRVTVPQLRPALVGASLLTFMTSGASFSAPLYFGADFPYLSVAIFRARNSNYEAEALTLTVVLACVSLLGVLMFRTRRPAATSASKGAPRALQSQTGRVAVGALAWIIILLLLTPHFAILWLSFVDHAAWHTELVPTDFTLNNYAAIFSDPSAFKPIRNSLWMSALAAFATLLFGLPAAYLIGRNRPGHNWVNFLVMIPWALPGTVVAMNLLIAFNVRWFPGLMLLPLGYFIRYIPLLTRVTSASISTFDAGLLDAAHTLGATRGYTLRHVAAPLLLPGLVAATALVFASALGEFVASVLLYRLDNIPIAVQIDQQWRGAGIGSAFAYSVFLMVLVTATFLFVRRFASRII